MLKFLRFDDLKTRFFSAVVLLSIAFICLFFGNYFFNTLILLLSIIVFYELCNLLNPTVTKPMIFIQLVVVLSALICQLSFDFKLEALLFLIPAIVLVFTCKRNPLLSFVTGGLIFISFSTFFEINALFGTTTLLWFISCVIATDLAGYFVGRIFGGPKIWLTVSPNKTWSGLIGGWIFALLVGSIFTFQFDQNYLIILLSLAISVTSQIGDFYESWLKRRIDRKDSSSLIPGHGGFLDRFDGFIGGALGFKICLLFINPELMIFG